MKGLRAEAETRRLTGSACNQSGDFYQRSRRCTGLNAGEEPQRKVFALLVAPVCACVCVFYLMAVLGLEAPSGFMVE